MWYRGVRYMKDYLTRYLNYVFIANSKGSIIFTDGTKSIKFSKTPESIKRASWDYRVLPAVLVGKATGKMEYLTFAKDVLKGDLNKDKNYDGGGFDIKVSLEVRATTIEERDNLLDITGIYLAHPDAKDYFLRQGIRLPDAPTIGGEKEIHETAIDYPIYSTEMTLRMMSMWEEERDMEERLLDILVDLEAYYDLDETGRIAII